MRPFWGGGGRGERGINWLVTIYVLAIDSTAVCSQYSNFRFALLRLKIEWNDCSLNLLPEKLNGIWTSNNLEVQYCHFLKIWIGGEMIEV